MPFDFLRAFSPVYYKSLESLQRDVTMFVEVDFLNVIGSKERVSGGTKNSSEI